MSVSVVSPSPTSSSSYPPSSSHSNPNPSSHSVTTLSDTNTSTTITSMTSNPNPNSTIGSSTSPITAAALAARAILPQLSISGGSPRGSPHMGARALHRQPSLAGAAGAAPSPRRASLLTPQGSSRALKLIDDDDSDEELTAEMRKKRKGSNKARKKHANYSHTFEDRWCDAKPIEEHGLIGNMRTCALIGTDAQIDWYCYPHFDSPSIFGSILDQNKGGFFSIKAARESDKGPVINRQLYHSETNVLISRFLSDTGVGQVRDFMPVGEESTQYVGWLVRELEVVRGKMYFEVECCPAFNYGRDQHTVEMIPHGARFRSPKLTMILTSARKRVWKTTPRGGVVTKVKLSEGQKAVFTFREDCQYQPCEPSSTASTPSSQPRTINKVWYNGNNTPIWANKGLAKLAHLKDNPAPEPASAPPPESGGSTERSSHSDSSQDQSASNCQQSREAMVAGVAALNQPLGGAHTFDRKMSIPHDGTSPWQGQETATGEGHGPEGLGCQHPSMDITDKLLKDTMSFWRRWISKCTYTGRWREAVYRSALVLKLLTFEPTGAIVAAATTSLPEHVGGHRNWDYRFTWIRDSSFVLYAFLKLGFKQEAVAFMKWVEQRCEELKDGSLQIMYGIHGEHQLHEMELDHLSGYMNSHPVRIGNGAFDQIQLDIYGELLDTVYLSNKYAEPISYSLWTHVRRMVDWMCEHWHDQDEGIWEVRSGRQHFVYSKVMCWVCLDRGIRLADHRSFPADVHRWRAVRDAIYEEIQNEGWSRDRQAFVQHYGSDTLDASVLIMPLVFFMSPTDPRFVKTLDAILASVADDGLVSNNLVFRYNVETTKDGLAGEEGTFSICTFWAVEAAARLGVFVPEYLEKSRTMFEQMLGYANHLGLYSEEIGKRGEHLGNFPQAFTHLALISAAVNLDKALNGHH